MALVSARVEEELKSPIQNMLAVGNLNLFMDVHTLTRNTPSKGDLMQLLLIQTQVMKVKNHVTSSSLEKIPTSSYVSR